MWCRLSANTQLLAKVDQLFKASRAWTALAVGGCGSPLGRVIWYLRISRVWHANGSSESGVSSRVPLATGGGWALMPLFLFLFVISCLVIIGSLVTLDAGRDPVRVPLAVGVMCPWGKEPKASGDPSILVNESTPPVIGWRLAVTWVLAPAGYLVFRAVFVDSSSHALAPVAFTARRWSTVGFHGLQVQGMA